MNELHLVRGGGGTVAAVRSSPTVICYRGGQLYCGTGREVKCPATPMAQVAARGQQVLLPGGHSIRTTWQANWHEHAELPARKHEEAAFSCAHAPYANRLATSSLVSKPLTPEASLSQIIRSPMTSSSVLLQCGGDSAPVSSGSSRVFDAHPAGAQPLATFAGLTSADDDWVIL